MLFLSEGTENDLESPAATFRVWSYLPYLAAAGIDATVRPCRPNKYRNGPRCWPRPARGMVLPFYELGRIQSRLRAIADADRFDVVVLQRELLPLGPPWLEEIVARRNPHILFDLDDATYLPSSGMWRWLLPASRADRIARLARVVTVGNEILAAWARERCADVRVVPTGVDVERFRPIERTEPDPPVVGWIGQPSNLSELVEIAPGLREAHRRRPFRLRIVTRLPASAQLHGLDVEWVAYDHERHPSLAADLDVALMPLHDDAWNRGKCAAKLLFSMACGVPVVASPVGVNAEIVENGQNGFLAVTDAEWARALSTMLDDREGRVRMGSAARSTVERRFSIRSLAPHVVDAIRAAARPRP